MGSGSDTPVVTTADDTPTGPASPQARTFEGPAFFSPSFFSAPFDEVPLDVIASDSDEVTTSPVVEELSSPIEDTIYVQPVAPPETVAETEPTEPAIPAATNTAPIPSTSAYERLANNLGPVPELLQPEVFQTFEQQGSDRPNTNDTQSNHPLQLPDQIQPPKIMAQMMVFDESYISNVGTDQFQQELQRTREDMAQVLEEQQQLESLIKTATLSVTTGALVWALRASSLLLTMFSMLPLWKGIDPLPILTSVNQRKDTLEQHASDSDKEDKDSSEVGYLFDKKSNI